MGRPDYVVVRFASDMPEGTIPEQYDGFWVDLREITAGERLSEGCVMGHPAIATGRYETREDGAVGEVYEVQRRSYENHMEQR